MAHPHTGSRSLSGRAYLAIFSQALPRILYTAALGAMAAAMFGLLAGFVAVDALDLRLVALYAVAGLTIGTAVGIRPVFNELRSFHWSADVLGR